MAEQRGKVSELWFRKINVIGPLGFAVPVNRKGRVFLAVFLVTFGVLAALFVTGFVPRAFVMIAWALLGAAFGLVGAAHTDWWRSGNPPSN